MKWLLFAILAFSLPGCTFGPEGEGNENQSFTIHVSSRSAALHFVNFTVEAGLNEFSIELQSHPFDGTPDNLIIESYPLVTPANGTVLLQIDGDTVERPLVAPCGQPVIFSIYIQADGTWTADVWYPHDEPCS